MASTPGRGIYGQRVVAAILLMVAAAAGAEEYLGREAFLALAFDGSKPTMHTLWLSQEQRAAARDKLGWAPTALRLRYWQAGERTAWILEDIGKEQPITLGISIRDNAIAGVEVLAFRESRGSEIRYPFFTSQFKGLTLASDGYLSKPVDGITGATLSVRAVERMTRLALWLNAQISS